MTIGRSYIKNSETIVFICPFCNAQIEEAIKDFNNKHDKGKIDCSCGNAYTVKVELRKHFRKKICLEGMYKKLTPPPLSGRMYILDLSMGGCRIDASISHKLQIGDKISLVFSLNDAMGRMIKKEAFVRSINKGYVGCEFIILPGSYDPDLGFYLKSSG